MRLTSCLIAWALASTPAPALAQNLDPDPFAPSGQGGEVEQMVRASLLGVPGADGAIAAWLDRHPEASVDDQVLLYHRLCNAYGVRAWHAMAAQACNEKSRLTTNSGNSAAMAAALASTPPVRAIGTTSIDLRENPLGSVSADVTANGVTLALFIDTGAEISVLSQGAADRLNVRYLADSVEVGTSTAPTEGRVAIIDLLRIGSASVENVPVLVLPDAQLTAGSFVIPGILGLPVFVAFRRMAWLEGGSRLVLGDDAPDIRRRTYQIYWHEDGVGIPVEVGGVVRGAHFDTGANSSYLWDHSRALLTADQQASLVARTIHIGGAGGIVEQQSEILPTWTSAIAGVPILFRCVTIDEKTSSSVGRIGSDALPQLSRLILDFETMTIEAEPVALPALEDASVGECS